MPSSTVLVPYTGPRAPVIPGGLAGSAGSSAAIAGQTAAAQLPGYMTSMGNIGTNIASETAGQVPEDVINLLKQQGAEGNVGTGAASNSAYLYALGNTSLGLKNNGQRNLESILHSTPGYEASQNPAFQTSSNLNYEAAIQQQIFDRQKQQQDLAFQQQLEALNAAKSGMATGGGGTQYSWAPPPTSAWSGPAFTTADLPGQMSAGGVMAPGGGGNGIQNGVAYGMNGQWNPNGMGDAALGDWSNVGGGDGGWY